MKFINYTNDGRVVIQHAALILSKLDETDTLELHTMDNAIILLKKDMTLVETRDVLQDMVRLARSMTLDALCNSDAEDKTPLVDESFDDEYEDTPLFSRSASEKTEIVRVTKDIKEGDEITAEMVQTVEVGAYNLPQNLMTDKKEIVGKYATADLAVGDYILSSKLSTVPAAENAYLYNLDGTKQAISVTIKSFATGLSGKLESGDIVTVIVADYQGKGETAIPPELQYVEVISVTASSGYDANTGEVVDEKELPSTVTLLVTTEQAKVLAELEQDTARWATDKEIKQTYAHVPFKVREWRRGQNLPTEQGLILGCKGQPQELTALVDSDDIHCLMIGASGIGKTAFFLYPNLEYACASGMSWLALDSKGDLARNYGTIAKNCYGYNVSVIDLRNPTRSDGNNLLTLVNRYMDITRKDPKNLAARAKAEKYAKILAKTIVNPDGDDSNRGQNAFFYDAAEGLLTSVILMLAEFLPPNKEHPQERRHIVSVFKLVQDLLEPSKVKGKSHFQLLMGKLPPDHKARWFAGAALNSAEQAMASVMSTVLSRLNAFLDSELEQVLCFDSAIDAEKFASEKSAIFLILPEEDTTKNFMAGLMIQNLSRELFAVADENGGKLQNRVVLYCDEFGTMPPFDVLPLLSAGRSRRLTLVPIIQSLAQLEKNYGKEGSEIIQDNCQDTIFGGFAPNSQTAEVLSKALGNRTVLSGSVSRGKNDPSQSLQMMERPLLTPDELKSIPKGNFIVQKTGQHPMRTRLRLFLEWGITFEKPYIVPERADRAVAYANREDLERNLPQSNKAENADMRGAYAVSGRGGIAHEPAVDKPRRRGGKQMKTYGEEDL